MMSTKPAPRRLVTYSKGSRDHSGSKAPAPRPANPAKDDFYDFPESEDETPRPAKRTAKATPAKPVARQKPKAEDLYDFPGSDDEARPPSKSATPARAKASSKPQVDLQQRNSTVKKPSTPSSLAQRSDEDRKRKHANAFDTIKAKKPSPIRHAEMPSRPVAPPSKPATKTYSAQSRITSFTATQATSASKPSLKQPPKPAPAPPEQDMRPFIPTPAPQPRALEGSESTIVATPRPQKKVRLIDRLASQKAESSGSDSESDSEGEKDASTSAGGTDRTPRLTSRAPSQTPMSQSSVRYAKDSRSRPGTLVNKKVKLTYSQARTFRQESQSQSQSQPQSLGAMMDSMQDALVSSPSPGPGDEFDMDDDDDEDIPKSGIKSLHELRRAGANSRFGDEMEDLMSRIGRPGASSSPSMRRNALLDLAQKLQRSDFAAQFRDHPARDTVADDIGEETEIISAFALGAALTIFLSSQNAPHMLRHLVEERIGMVLAVLLRQADDIDILAKRRENNLSKMSRVSVNQIKTHLVGMPIWHGCKLETLSPRVLALRLLLILQCNLDSQSQSDVLRHLETELSDTAETHARDDPAHSINFVLVALIMEAASEVDTLALGRDQVARQAVTSAQLLQKAITKWPDDLGEVPSAILKLSINTTNTELGARAFGHEETLAELARCITEGLVLVQRAVAKGTLKDGLYDGLLLNMGVLINILEHCPTSRRAMDDESLRKLARLYIESRPSAMEADTEEKSKASVAVGYLAVVLGYLCLEERGRKAMGHGSQGSAMRGLTNSIQHFMELYRSVDTRVQELEGLVVDLQRFSR